MKVWRLMTHHDDLDDALKWTRINEKIAIGWGFIGDLTRYNSPEEISHAIRKHKEHKPKNSGQGGVCLWNFLHEMQEKDLVLLNTKKGPALVVQVDGHYKWDERESRPDEYHHQRRALVTEINPQQLWRKAGARAIEGQSIRWTLIQCARSVDSPTLE